MDVVIKNWGVQVWQGHELIMIMRAKTKTSTHKHLKHDTFVECLSGNCWMVYWAPSGRWLGETSLNPGQSVTIPIEMYHQIEADSDCVLRENYYAKTPTSVKPLDDIERCGIEEQ